MFQNIKEVVMAMNRRDFLNRGMGVCATAIMPGCTSLRVVKAAGPMKKNQPGKALVAWYSQTGHTKLYAKVIEKAWGKLGIDVHASDIREIDRETLGSYDLIAVGTPVFYYDMPIPVKEWLNSIPEIKGTPVAAFVSYGGPGGNVHNTAVGMLELLSKKGGVPVGMHAFGNMGAFPPDWAGGATDNVLKYRHLPDEGTFEAVKLYAEEVLKNVNENKPVEVSGNIDLREFIKGGMATWSIKALTGEHTIDKTKCIKCGVCLRKCPTNAIDIKSGSISSSDCILCFGCMNSCPVQAHDMKFMGKKMYGFNELLKQNHITIPDPLILKS